VRLPLPALLTVLYMGLTLMSVLLWLFLAFAGLLLVVGFPELTLPMLGVLVVMVPGVVGIGHLRSAVRLARRSTPLDGEVAWQVGRAGGWLLTSGALIVPLTVLLWTQVPPQERAAGPTPSDLLSALLGLALPLLLIGLSGWLDEGRRLRDRAREVV